MKNRRLLFGRRQLPAVFRVTDFHALHEIGGKLAAEQIFRGIGVAVFRLGIAVPKVKGQTAHPDGAAGLPTAVHTLRFDTVLLEIKHLADVGPCFRGNPHDIKERLMIAVIFPGLTHHPQKEIAVFCGRKPDIEPVHTKTSSPPNTPSPGLVVIRAYSFVLRGKRLTKGTSALP